MRNEDHWIMHHAPARVKQAIRKAYEASDAVAVETQVEMQIALADLGRQERIDAAKEECLKRRQRRLEKQSKKQTGN